MRTTSAKSGTHSAPGRWRIGALVALSLPLFLWVARMAPVAQAPEYHDFADQRPLLGLPHFWNVASNLPFAVVGFLGCWWLIRGRRRSDAFAEPGERVAYFVFFVGEFLACFGSAYYHSAPGNGTLVWDRLILSLMLTSFLTIVVTEFISVRLGSLLLAPAVALGLYGVLYWSWTESVDRGDLRLYLLVQFYPAIGIPIVMLLFRSRYTHGGALLLTWAFYGVAKVCESYDWPIYELTGLWSGHTFKHLVAAIASCLPLYSLQLRSVRIPADVVTVDAVGA